MTLTYTCVRCRVCSEEPIGFYGYFMCGLCALIPISAIQVNEYLHEHNLTCFYDELEN